jgi:two-component system sensor kinase
MRAKEFVGLAMRLPVYRNGMPIDSVEKRRAAFIGSVGAGFIVENLMRNALEDNTLQSLRFRLYDAGPNTDRPSPTPANERLLFDSNQLAGASPAESTAEDENSAFVKVLQMEVGGRNWEIHFSARKDAAIGHLDKFFPFSVLAGGILSSLLLFGVLYSLSSSRSQAIRIAAQITKDLRASEERFRLISENASDLITLLDPQGRHIYVNPAYSARFGTQLIGADAFAYVHPDDRERVRQTFLKTAQTGIAQRAEFRFLLASGEVRYIESQGSAVRNPDGSAALVVVVSRDVTDRRLTEDALRAREVQLQEAQALAKLGHWEWDLRKDTRQWSEQVLRNFGITDTGQPVRYTDFLALVHPEDREHMEKALRKAIDTGTVYEGEYRVVNPAGRVRTIYARARVDRDESGRAVRMLGVSQDVTDRKRAEEQVRVSEERFRTMVENVRDYAIHMLDTEGYITSWNLGAERITGYQAEEIIGRHYSRFFLPEHAARGDPGMQLQFAAIQGRYESEGWRITRNGTRFWAHVIVTPMHDASGKLRGFSNITHDITERKRAEEDLHTYAERLKAMSRRLVEVQEAERRLLAAELHDRAGQSLTALGLNLSMIGRGLSAEAKPESAARLEECASLVRDTVDAMRDVMKELRPLVLDDYGLPAALRALSASFSERTGIKVDFSGSDSQANLPKPVDLALFRIAQEAFNNIAKHSKASRVEIALSRLNGHATLSIRDDGVGFSPKRAEGSDKESGWGLLIMRERAEAVGAHFRLDTDSGAGVQVQVEYRL